jgi:hypothetical protein
MCRTRAATGRPAPFFNPRHQPGAQGVPLDVTHYGIEVVVGATGIDLNRPF